MGWQPGHSWWVFHRGYADPLDGDYPQVPEQDLALGHAAGGLPRRERGLLSRAVRARVRRGEHR